MNFHQLEKYTYRLQSLPLFSGLATDMAFAHNDMQRVLLMFEVYYSASPWSL